MVVSSGLGGSGGVGADGFDCSVVHLANHDVTLCAVSRAPRAIVNTCG
jgi:predicted dithiol-disulfide oxidoreductase (DUF899 family)